MSGKNKLTTEKKTIKAMIDIFCSAHHQTKKNTLCFDCSQLIEYANARLDKCPFGPDKGPCLKCEIHCYKQEMRDKIKQVMRFSGPRMLKSHPILAINHLIKEKTAKPKED
ncbi:MAG: nitrous oxide-stimulated promoter family protein [Planctomycetes bacterium]|nr:nitrous oxide-stimulated promoter family protein [Planctomycetota bacterium]